MNRETPGALLLFELIARRWTVPAAALGVVFSRSQSRLAAPLADGRIALIDCADPEPPESRIAVDAAGRRAISPRRSDPRPATIIAASDVGPVVITTGPGESFLVARPDSGLDRLEGDGTVTPIEPPGHEPLIAFDKQGSVTLMVTRGRVALWPDDGSPTSAPAPDGVRSAALSLDGSSIAFGGEASIALANSAAPGEIVARCPTPGPVGRIVWRDDGAFLAAECGRGALALLDCRSGRLGVVDGFPAPPQSIAFSGPANALVASGAYRMAAWDLARPPFDGDRSGALETGRPAMVAVVAVAAHPRRKLIAAAFANGQVTIAEPGQRDEMLIRPSGSTPAALAWSADGAMLAIASADTVSLAAPEALFKSS